MSRRSAPSLLAVSRLLEIMMAVAILGMMAIAIFRFVQANFNGGPVFIRTPRQRTRNMMVSVNCLQLNGKA